MNPHAHNGSTNGMSSHLQNSLQIAVNAANGDGSPSHTQNTSTPTHGNSPNREKIHPVLRKFLFTNNNRSSVQIQSLLGSTKNVYSSNVFGRDEEIAFIVEYLFTSLLASMAQIEPLSAGAKKLTPVSNRSVSNSIRNGTNGSSSNSNSSCMAPDAYFSPTQPSRKVSLYGPQGVGKYAIIAHITRQIAAASKQDSRYNVCLFKNRKSTFKSIQPFSAWKSIFRDMLARLHRFLMMTQNVEYSSRVQAGSSNTSASTTANGKISPKNHSNSPVRKNSILTQATGVTTLLNTLDYLQEFLSPEMQQLRPLLGAYSLIPPLAGNEATAALSGQLRIDRTCELMDAIIQLYPVITKRVIIFTL